MPRTAANNVPYWVSTRDGKPAVSAEWTLGVNQETWVCQVKASDLSTWIRDMMGFSEYSTGAPTGLHRQLPERHPVNPWMTPCHIRVVEVAGVMTEGSVPTLPGQARSVGTLQFDPAAEILAEVTWRGVRYSLFRDDEINNNELARFCTLDRKYGLDVLPLTMVQFKFADTGEKIQPSGGAGPTIRYPYQDYAVTWHEVPCEIVSGRRVLPTYLSDAITNCMGCVNGEAFLGCAPQTLLMSAPEITEELSALGLIQYKIVYHFQYRATGWNTKYRPKLAPGAPASGHYAVVIDDSSSPPNPPYALRDFNALFRLKA